MYNATFSCVYPISGQYAFLQRTNYYFLLVFALLGQRHKWLVRAALGSAITYAGVTALHAFVLVVLLTKQPKIIDLDILATFLILGLSIVILWPLLHFNTELKGHRLEPLIKLWIALISIGAISAVLGMNIFMKGLGQSCELPMAPFSNHTFAGNFNAYEYANTHCNLTACADKLPLLRAESSLQSFMLHEVLDASDVLLACQCFILTAAIYTLLTIVLPTTRNGDVRLACRFFAFQVPSKVIDVLFIKHSGFHGGIAAAASLVAIFAEIYLPEYPQEDSAKLVGQWGPWVATMLLGGTAAADSWLAVRKARRSDKTAGGRSNTGRHATGRSAGGRSAASRRVAGRSAFSRRAHV